jgi:DEAD/DEAH box helicase domain-containing protein
MALETALWDDLLDAEEVAHTTNVPALDARFAPFPDELHPGVREALAAAGLDELYAHQRDVWDAAVRGENVVVTTGTASGKSLAFNLPVVDAIAREPKVRALYL